MYPASSISIISCLCCLSLSSFRDGPDTSSPQLGVFSGNTALESAYSTSLKVLIRFHSDFSTGGFFILNFHGTETYSHTYLLDTYEHTGIGADVLSIKLFKCQNLVLGLNAQEFLLI